MFLEANTLECESSRERKFPGHFAPGSESFREREGVKTLRTQDISALRKILGNCATLDGKVDECLPQFGELGLYSSVISQYHRIECWPKCVTTYKSHKLP